MLEYVAVVLLVDALEDWVMRENPEGTGPAPKVLGAVAKLDAGMLPTILAAQAGDAHARTALQRHYDKYVKNVATALMGRWAAGHGKSFPTSARRSAADDIASEVWMRVLVGTGRSRPAIERFTPRAQFGTWLYAVVRNCTKLSARSRARGQRDTGPVGPAQAHEPELVQDIPDDDADDEGLDEYQDRELRARAVEDKRAIEAAFPNLTPASQNVLAARQGVPERGVPQKRWKTPPMRYRELATRLGVSVPVVMTRLYRARKELEELSGVPLQGIAAELQHELGGIVRGRAGRPRKNPADMVLYFETVEDVDDLVAAGILPSALRAQCVAALG